METKRLIGRGGIRGRSINVEKTKIECDSKIFIEIAGEGTQRQTRYDVVDNYERLLDLVR